MAPALPRRIWTALNTIKPSIELMSVGSGGSGLARAVGFGGGRCCSVSASWRSLSLSTSTALAPVLALPNDQAPGGHARRRVEAEQRQHRRRHIRQAPAIVERPHLR